jgi:hypothetical protein
VTAIEQSPPSFTVRSIQDGSDSTYRVLDTTVFYVPPDRPYNFGLLKVGDQVLVAGGGGRCQPGAAQSAMPTPTPDPACANRRQQLGQPGAGQPAGAPAGQPAPGRARPGLGGALRTPGQAGLNGAGRLGRGGPADGQPVARRVIVRPAGEPLRGRGLGQPGQNPSGQPGLPGQPNVKKGASNGASQ